MKIHADHQPYRKKPFVARWYEGSRQRNKFFASAAARDEYIHQLKETAQRQDPILPTIPPHQLIRWQQAMAIAPDADPVEVFKFWKAEQRKIAKLGDRYLHDAAAGYIQSMENVGRNKSYIGHVRRALTDLEWGQKESGLAIGVGFRTLPKGRQTTQGYYCSGRDPIAIAIPIAIG